MYCEVIPAYGRDYKSASAVKADWQANRDFIDAASGRYINRQDAESAGLIVMARYAKLRKVTRV
jgi:hypothetical protein